MGVDVQHYLTDVACFSPRQRELLLVKHNVNEIIFVHFSCENSVFLSENIVTTEVLEIWGSSDLFKHLPQAVKVRV